MPDSRRSRPPKTNGAGPAEETIKVGARRSRRLRHVEPDEGELPVRKRRRREPQSDNKEPADEVEIEVEDGVEDEDEEEDEDEDASTSEGDHGRRANGLTPSRKLWPLAPNGRPRSNLRTATPETVEPERRSIGRRPQRRKAPFEPESQEEDIYDIPPSPPRASRRTAGASQLQREIRNLNPEDELFVLQDEHGDTQLYDEPTRVGDEDEQGPSDNEAPPTLSQIADNLPNMDEYSENHDRPAELAYPDDHLLFNAPAGQDGVTAVPLTSKALKSMVELMDRPDWETDRERLWLSQIRRRWNDLCSLHVFWSLMPRAPRYDAQTHHLHSSEEAAKAKESIQSVDELVNSVVKLAAASDEDDLRIVIADLRGMLIPRLVSVLLAVFRVGMSGYPTKWCAMVTDLTMQIMNRVLAWIRHLYGAMMKALKLLNRGNHATPDHDMFRRHLEALEAEFDEALKELRDIPVHRREQEERRQKILQRQEEDRKREEEKKNWQYEIAYRRIRERYGSREAEPPRGSQLTDPPRSTTSQETLASQRSRTSLSPQLSSQPSSQRTWPTPASSTTSVNSREAVNNPEEDSWSDDKKLRLLGYLKKHPNPEGETWTLLSWEYGCSKEEVRNQVERLRKAARETYGSRNRPVPEFARI